jgi:hypothetical protein
MSAPTSTTIKETLRQHLPELREEYGMDSFALFGSYVRAGNHLETPRISVVQIPF